MYASRVRGSMVLVTTEGQDDQLRTRAIAALPAPYSVALRLHEAGASHQLIAVALGVDEQTIPSVLHLAEAKLASVRLPHPSVDT